MKYRILISLTFTLILLSACQNQLETPVTFNFSASSTGSSMSGDTLIVTKSVPVTFNFTGNPDIITFYSGETAHEFSKKDLILLPASEITSSYLTFTNMPQYGTIPGTLKVYLSTSFSGLLQNNKVADSTAVVSQNWIELTDSCNLSTTSAVINNSKISLKNYLGNKLTLAFLYKTNQNTAIQPTWEIGNLQVKNTLKSGTVNIITASSIGFNTIDMLSTTAPYLNTGGAGVWDITNIALVTTPKFRISSSNIGLPINVDWIISNPTILNSRLPDTGVSVKAMANLVNKYQYTFSKAGVYSITFQASIHNYQYYSGTSKSMIIKVK